MVDLTQRYLQEPLLHAVVTALVNISLDGVEDQPGRTKDFLGRVAREFLVRGEAILVRVGDEAALIAPGAITELGSVPILEGVTLEPESVLRISRPTGLDPSRIRKDTDLQGVDIPVLRNFIPRTLTFLGDRRLIGV